MKQSIYLFGIGTTAFRIKSFIEYHSLYEIKGFVVDDKYKNECTFLGKDIISLSEFKNLNQSKRLSIFICSAWNRLNQDRTDIYNRLNQEYNLVNIISPSAIIRGNISGKNIFIGDMVLIESGARIESNVFIDHLSFIGTHTNILQNSYIAARAMIAGNVEIGNQSFIGINATIFDEVKIGHKCIISGGITIKRNVPNCCVIKSSKNDQNEISIYTENEIVNKLIAQKNVR